MKGKFYLLIVAGMLAGQALMAQLPEKAEDISPLLIGEKIPELTLTALDGKTIGTQAVLNGKPSVILVYRGGWCSYCNKHMAEIGTIEKEILDLGYQIIAINPDSPEKLKEAKGKSETNYILYSDSEGFFSKGLGIAFKAPERYAEMLTESSAGKNGGFLPVPSVYVVNSEGLVMFEYINPDFKVRISAKLMLAVLQSL
jgi:peroxiredoxin